MVARQTGMLIGLALFQLDTAAQQIGCKLMNQLGCDFRHIPMIIECFFVGLNPNYSGYMVKPHGQLVLVSSTPHNAYTPSLSTL